MATVGSPSAICLGGSVSATLLKHEDIVGVAGSFPLQTKFQSCNRTRRWSRLRGTVRPRAAAEDSEQEKETPSISKKSVSSIETLEATLGRRRSRRQAAAPKKETVNVNFEAPKKQKKPLEEMSTSEKVVELWLGEKGGLFWLNRLAWGAIISLIIAWIIFRFVGPSLGLYELDSPLLPPTEAF